MSKVYDNIQRVTMSKGWYIFTAFSTVFFLSVLCFWTLMSTLIDFEPTTALFGVYLILITYFIGYCSLSYLKSLDIEYKLRKNTDKSSFVNNFLHILVLINFVLLSIFESPMFIPLVVLVFFMSGKRFKRLVIAVLIALVFRFAGDLYNEIKYPLTEHLVIQNPNKDERIVIKVLEKKDKKTYIYYHIIPFDKGKADAYTRVFDSENELEITWEDENTVKIGEHSYNTKGFVRPV